MIYISELKLLIQWYIYGNDDNKKEKWVPEWLEKAWFGSSLEKG